VILKVTDPSQIQIDRGVELGGYQATLCVPDTKGVLAAYKKKAIWKKFAAIETFAADAGQDTATDEWTSFLELIGMKDCKLKLKPISPEYDIKDMLTVTYHVTEDMLPYTAILDDTRAVEMYVDDQTVRPFKKEVVFKKAGDHVIRIFARRMKKQERYDRILAHFREKMPIVNTELEFGSVFQLLVAVILSAQCTYKRINQVTPELFRRYPDATSMALAEADEVLEYIKSVSYPNSKAEHLVKMARKLVENFDGEVPSDMNALLDLPGVGRKTANVIQSVVFGKSTMAVDTHVFRVSHRLGLVPENANTPYKVELVLSKNIPADDIPRAHHWLLLHGRYVCTSRKPHCERCGLSAVCPSASH
jgi:endonuclease-3